MNIVHPRNSICILLLLITLSSFAEVSPWDISSFSKKVREQLEVAQNAFQEERWNEAHQLYQELANENPELPIVYIGVGDASAKKRDYTNAITAFHRALDLIIQFPQSERIAYEPTVQAKLASAYHRSKQLDEADAWFQKAVHGAGENAPVTWYIALGQLETERGNLEQARRYYIVAVQLEPETTAAYNNLGYVLLRLNRYDEADAVFREALTLDKTLASAAYGRGEVSRKRGHFEISQRFYEQAIDGSPHEPLFHKSLADLFDQLGDIEQANATRSRYRQTLAEVYRKQAHPFIERQQGKPAIELLQKALETDDTYVPALKDYAYVKLQLNELQSAKKMYQRVLKFEPGSRQALLHLGMIEGKLGNRSEGESHLFSLMQNEPNFMDTYSQLAKLREAYGDLAGAEDAYTLGIQHQPGWAPGYLWRGQILQQGGESEKAERDFRHAIQLAPDIPYPKDALASLLALENRSLEEALVLAKDVVATDKRPTHIATLALVYFRLKRTADARRVITEAFSQNPSNTYIQKIRSEIIKVD